MRSRSIPRPSPPPTTITLAGAALELSDKRAATSITGPAAGVTISGGGQSRVFQVDGGVTASLSGLTITGGSAIEGGGVDNAGTLTMSDCTVSGDSASIAGGVYNRLGAAMMMSGCTIAGNSAVYGGGVCNLATLTMSDCTVAGDTATDGGGLLNVGELTMSGCTVASDTATDGGGLLNDNMATLNNSIVADSVKGVDIDNEGTLTGGYDMIGDGSGGAGLTHTISGDPKLGPLTWNGGPTQTMAVLPGSPAIDAGSDALIPAGVTTDQRGAPRINGTSVDIGAYEDLTQVAVNTLADTAGPPAGSALSLRQAIGLVETFDPSGDTITFAPGLSGTIALSSPLPAIAGSMAIAGPGPTC